MRRIITLGLILAICLTLAACYTHTHVVGKGAQGKEITMARQWYAVYGLAPLNDVNTKKMVGDTENYEIVTQQTFIDGIINMFTSSFTVTCRTVQVKK